MAPNAQLESMAAVATPLSGIFVIVGKVARICGKFRFVYSTVLYSVHCILLVLNKIQRKLLNGRLSWHTLIIIRLFKTMKTADS